MHFYTNVSVPCTPKMNSSSARIGYARVSTADQNFDAQTAALEAAGCTMVRTETGDGATLAGQSELGTILEFIHPGETLVVTRIDRLARSCAISRSLSRPSRTRAPISPPPNSGGHLDRCRQGVLRHARRLCRVRDQPARERQAEGVAAAKQRATYRGRPPRIDMEAIKHRLARGLSPTAIARELRISRGTVYKARADMTDIA